MREDCYGLHFYKSSKTRFRLILYLILLIVEFYLGLSSLFEFTEPGAHGLLTELHLFLSILKYQEISILVTWKSFVV